MEIDFEPYEIWKQRMLENAYKELNQLKMKENEKKLKSPRKATVNESKRISTRDVTPQKKGTQGKDFSSGTPLIEVTRISPKKDISRGTPQKVTRSSPQKGISRGTPQKDVTKYTPPEDPIANILCDISPRRSPRKSPQKFSPYPLTKTPIKSNGVRLLFPTNL